MLMSSATASHAPKPATTTSMAMRVMLFWSTLPKRFEQRDGPISWPRRGRDGGDGRNRAIRKTPIGRQGLAVNERGDVVLHELGLAAADPLRRAAQKLDKQQHRRHQDGGDDNRPPVASGTDSSHDSVDHRAGEVNGGDREKPVNDEKNR